MTRSGRTPGPGGAGTTIGAPTSSSPRASRGGQHEGRLSRPRTPLTRPSRTASRSAGRRPGPDRPGRQPGVAGLGYGIGGSAVKTGQDFAKLGTGIAHTAEHLWDSVF